MVPRGSSGSLMMPLDSSCGISQPLDAFQWPFTSFPQTLTPLKVRSPFQKQFRGSSEASEKLERRSSASSL
eukprot:9108222-Pyramimonas_sp.AAC.1